MHGHESQVPAARRLHERGLQVEAASIVAHLCLDALLVHRHHDPHSRGVGVLANVRQRLMDHIEQRYLLRDGQQARVALDRHARLDVRAGRKRPRHVAQRASEGPVQENGGRVNFVGYATQLRVEGHELRIEVLEAAAHDLSLRRAREHALELVAKQAQVLREDRYLLDRAVVQVEAEPGELALAGLHQRPLRGRIGREQRVALEHRPQHRNGLEQEGRCHVARARVCGRDQGRERLLPAAHRDPEQ